MKKIILVLSAVSISAITHAQQPVYKSAAFSIYKDKVVQGNNEAKALSPTHMQSNYQSPANALQPANIIFKFSINGRDNEMFAGKEHHFTVNAVNGVSETPIIKFGMQLNQPEATGKYLQPNTQLKIRVDMKDVMKQFNELGYYTTIHGDKIYKEDYKGVFVAGPTAPMTWDFDNIMQHGDLQLKDEDGDGIYGVTMVINKPADEKHTETEWTMTKDISPYPQYKSDMLIADAVYNLSLEEMLKAIEPDSTFRTGKEWGGVWTRDISYSIILSMAHMQPRVAMFSLMRKVNKKKRIIQDTGTGGAWPVSTDRMIWAVAAWEIYKATGDKDWLQQAYEIVKNSIGDDIHNVHDPETGLVKGESSFLDWREQTYPKWMQPADIYESECLGTNAVHYQANNVLSQMAAELHDEAVAAKHKAIAERIKQGINKYLWVPEKGYYAQFRYGRGYKFVSPRSEALGEALCVIFGIADDARSKQVVSRVPLTSFGISCIYPQIPNIPPYHNNAVWPFVQSYWLWAAAKAGNEKAVLEAISDIYRPAALFLTNKENFVVDNGDYNGTQVNSSIMLWSLSGNISIVQKVLFGIRFNKDGISFEPFVPAAMAGNRTLNNFHYRDAVLNIEMAGFGNKIRTFFIDGKPSLVSGIPASLKGTHVVKIILADNPAGQQKINKVANYVTISNPTAKFNGTAINWEPVKGAVSYKVLQNGKMVSQTAGTSYTVSGKEFAEYAVIAVDAGKVESFASEPVAVDGTAWQKTTEMETLAGTTPYNYKGYTGSGFAEISNTVNKTIDIPVDVPLSGTYLVCFRYANGNGPGNTENKCAIRSMKVDGTEKATVVFPQRARDEWSNWGWSNKTRLSLAAGKHTITLSLEDYNDNMNGEINQAMLDQFTIIHID